MIGVLGGMGPAATIDFLAKLTRLYPAEREQEQLPIVAVLDPRVPDRVAPILEGRGESPLPMMLAGLQRLERAGARCIAIPCHTAHFWYDQLAAATELPILHIVDATIAELRRLDVPRGPLGLLATAATLKAGLYQTKLRAAGYTPIEPSDELMGACVLPAIALVKRERASEAAGLLRRAVEHLAAGDARAALLACTELPLACAAAVPPLPGCIDATEALARACIGWYGGQEGQPHRAAPR